jgi:hypothetical protein
MSNNLDKAINQQVIKSITDPIFLKPLENHISGYSRVSARAMIQCLFNAYGNITPLKLDANYKMMTTNNSVHKGKWQIGRSKNSGNEGCVHVGTITSENSGSPMQLAAVTWKIIELDIMLPASTTQELQCEDRLH